MTIKQIVFSQFITGMAILSAIVGLGLQKSNSDSMMVLSSYFTSAGFIILELFVSIPALIRILLKKARGLDVYNARGFPILGVFMGSFSWFQRERDRLRDEEIGNTLGQLGRAKSDDEYKARLRRVANAFGSLGSLEALSEHSLVRSWSETLAEAMKLHRQRQAMESLYVRALSDGLKLLVNEGFITSDLAAEIGDVFELNVDGEISSYEKLSKAAVTTEATKLIEDIQHNNLSWAKQIVALLELEDIEMDFE